MKDVMLGLKDFFREAHPNPTLVSPVCPDTTRAHPDLPSVLNVEKTRIRMSMARHSASHVRKANRRLVRVRQPALKSRASPGKVELLEALRVSYAIPVSHRH